MTRSLSNFLGKTTVQAVIAFTLVGAATFGFATDRIDGDAFMVQVASVIAFFFGKNGTSPQS